MLGLAILSGCIFSPERKKAPPPPPPVVYLRPISPQNVLQNLIGSYVGRDSVGTDSVYDNSYIGTSTDLSLPTPIPSFSKADEVRHVGRLRLDPNIVSVYLDLGSPASWQVLDGNPTDPPGYKIIQISNQVVRIEDISRATTWQSQNQIIEYAFKPTAVPAAPPEADTTWTVVRWTEFAN
jgi:hypothetical protein